MNLKEITTKQKLADAKQQRVEDFIRSGGSGSLRSSIFNRQDEALTKETIETFYDNFADLQKADVKGGNLEGSNGKKKVIVFYTQIPDKVPLGNGVDALLAKVDYDRSKKIFKAMYRPKNGKWGQAQSVDETVEF
jgi:hypothetical protein